MQIAPTTHANGFYLTSSTASSSHNSVPRLNYTKAIVILQIISLWFVDGLVFGILWARPITLPVDRASI
ncbi:hypothetical protein PILCRDRAFT_747179 [Piloderma croceum F 1598]|uniref:Uncharacterized protein n=1 Tax=Piloderma croceum (strain F 1598) TaxID=765440 RepID=A0A0C3ADU6_PILCF|nr:hypothetical protein PILCRDRAFT_747179 [Piloderma croceum F 1598]